MRAMLGQAGGFVNSHRTLSPPRGVSIVSVADPVRGAAAAASPGVEVGALSRAAARRRLIVLLLVGAVLYAVPVWWGLPSEEGWAVDEIVPAEVVEAQRWPDKYPPFHRHLLSVLDRGVAALGALSGATAASIHQRQFVVHRLTSVCLALLTLWIVYRVAREVGDRATALWAAALVAPTLPLVYYAKTANLDVPYLAWFALSALCLVRALDTGRWRAYVGLGAAAALAVSTKDQAYGLYVVVPAVLLWDLARRRRAAGRPAWSALLDRRLWLAGAAATACLGLVWALAPEGELARHLGALTSDRAVGRYRIYPFTLRGQWEQAAQSARYVWLAAGPTTSLAALAGVGIALGRPRRHRLPLALLAAAASYYLFFMVPIGYNYVRFLLPVLLVTGLFAALGLRRVLAWPALGRWGRLALAVPILGWPLSRAVLLDLHMAGDARYGAEEWLRSTGHEARAVGFGDERHLPRRIETIDWRRLEDEPCRLLGATGAAVLVVNPDEVRGDRERASLGWLAGGLSGYRPADRFANRFPADLFHRPGVQWNLNKIAREIVVLRSSGEECFDAAGVWRRLRRRRQGEALPNRTGLAAAIVAGVVESRPLGGRRASVAGLAPDGWTRGSRPAAVVVRGRASRAARPRFDVVSPAMPVGGTATFFVEDGGSVTAVPLHGPRTTIQLPAVAPGVTALFVVWTDRAWTPEGSRRVLGVRLLPSSR